VIESVEHMMFPLYNEVRHRSILNRMTEDTRTGFLEDKENFELIHFYVTEVFRQRKEFTLTENDSSSPPPHG